MPSPTVERHTPPELLKRSPYLRAFLGNYQSIEDRRSKLATLGGSLENEMIEAVGSKRQLDGIRTTGIFTALHLFDERATDRSESLQAMEDLRILGYELGRSNMVDTILYDVLKQLKALGMFSDHYLGSPLGRRLITSSCRELVLWGAQARENSTRRKRKRTSANTARKTPPKQPSIPK